VASDRKQMGDFVSSDSWDDYWRTAIAQPLPEYRIRGYSFLEVTSSLSYAENVYLVIRGELPTPQQARVLEAGLCVNPDAGLFSVHALAGRTVASAQPNTPVPAIAAGILCAGDVTISPQAAGTLIERGLAATRAGAALAEAARQIVEEHEAAGQRIPGIGHPLHRGEDPRGALLRRIAEEQGTWGAGGDFYDALHAALIERKGIHLPINVDGVLAAVLYDLGFTPRQMPGIALLVILPGLIAHVDEEITDGVLQRVVPKSQYVGEPPRPLVGGHWASTSA
jgi:citryl-CoA lyase